MARVPRGLKRGHHMVSCTCVLSNGKGATGVTESRAPSSGLRRTVNALPGFPWALLRLPRH